MESRKPKVESRKSKAGSGFTLMELLVVITVIAILVGLLLPALFTARERARVSKARGEIMAIQQAWLGYWQTYGELPLYNEMTKEAVEVLGGNNPSRIAFMELDNRHWLEGFRDPWGHLYKMNLSRDQDVVPTQWSYQTRVHAANTARSRY